MARYPAIPEPTIQPVSLRDSILSLKQAFETLTGQRGNPGYAALVPADLSNINEALTWIDGRLKTVETLLLNNVVRNDITQAFTDFQVSVAQLNIRLGKATQLASGFDLNNLKTVGLYDGPNLLNSPDGTTNWFYINVRLHSNYQPGTNEWIIQDAWCLTDPTMRGYTRLSSAPTTWGAWKRFTLT